MRCKYRTARIAAGRASWSLLFALAVYGPAFGQSPETTSRVITLSVVNGEIVGRDVVRVTQGDRVDLRWVTDVPLVIHLHGYDMEKSLEPGIDATMHLDAHATGRFPITVHGFSPPADSHDGVESLGHGGGEKTLIYLEVHPD